MVQLLLFVLLAFVAIGIIAALVVAHFVRKGVRKVRSAMGFDQAAGQGKSRTGTYGGGSQSRTGRQSAASSGLTIIDTRPPEVARRRIFSDDEGEYVDYEEVE